MDNNIDNTYDFPVTEDLSRYKDRVYKQILRFVPDELNESKNLIQKYGEVFYIYECISWLIEESEAVKELISKHNLEIKVMHTDIPRSINDDMLLGQTAENYVKSLSPSELQAVIRNSFIIDKQGSNNTINIAVVDIILVSIFQETNTSINTILRGFIYCLGDAVRQVNPDDGSVNGDIRRILLENDL
jgi:hypothetical protein